MIEPAPALDDSAPRTLIELPGVTAVHDPRPPLARVMDAAAGVIRIERPRADGVLVSTDATGTTVTTAISTVMTARTPEVARAVADAVIGMHPEADRITVQVRRIARA